MPNPIRILVAADPHMASPNKRQHFHVIAKIKRTMRSAASWAWIGAGKPRATGPVHVTVIVRRGRAIDLDNALAGCKPLIDGLFNGAITPDDSMDWVKGYTIRQEVGKRYAGGAAEVEFIAEVTQ